MVPTLLATLAAILPTPHQELSPIAPTEVSMLGLTPAEVAARTTATNLDVFPSMQRHTLVAAEAKGDPCSKHFPRMRDNLLRQAMGICKGSKPGTFTFRTHQRKSGGVYFCRAWIDFTCK